MPPLALVIWIHGVYLATRLLLVQRVAEGPDRLVTRAAIEDELVQRLDVDRPRAAHILRAVGRTLAQNVGAGQIDDVCGQFSEELRRVFPERPAA